MAALMRCWVVCFALLIAMEAGAAEREDAKLWALVDAARDVANAHDGPLSAEDTKDFLGPLGRLEALRRPTVREFARSSYEMTTRANEYLEKQKLEEANKLRTWWNEGGRERMQAKVPPEVFAAADDAFEEYSDVRQDVAIAELQSRLARFEAKYSEGAPRLNLLEIAINYGLQGVTWLSWFRPNDAGPSPNEIVAGYSTTYATVEGEEAALVSVLEFGWRRFNLSWRPGDGVGAMAWPPRYWTVGVAVAEESNGALRWPLEGPKDTRRVGPFISYGDIKAALLMNGSERQFIVSRQFQLLPHLF